MNISTILRSKGRDVFHVAPGTLVADAIGVLNDKRIGAVLVLDGDRICGVFSERDVMRGLHGHGVAILQQSVDAVMTKPVITVTPDDSCGDAMTLMTNRRIRHLPVVSNGQLLGLVSIGDLVKHRIEEIEREAAALKDYITAV